MVEIIKTLIRPLLTVGFVAAWAVLVFVGRAEVKDFVMMASLAAAFWFGSRTEPPKAA